MAKKNKKFGLLPRLMAWVFVGLAAAQAVAAVGAFSSPEVANAQETFDPQVSIGDAQIMFDQTTAPIAAYIKAVYTYAVGAVGILAAVMLMIGGLRWILAGGNPSSISEAREMIFASITGMVLVLTSYIVLSQVNPALVNLGENVTSIKLNINPETTSTGGYSMCEWTKLETNQTCPQAKGDGWVLKDNCSASTKPTGEDALKYSCCCPPIPEGCPDDYSLNCQACDSCQTLTVPCKSNNSCQVAPALASKLNDVYANYSGWQVTEAWPPTYSHISSCHAKGLCVDVNLTGTTQEEKEDPTKVKTLAEKLTASGFTSFQYECTSGPGCCSSYDAATKCKYNQDASGNHFHVNQ